MELKEICERNKEKNTSDEEIVQELKKSKKPILIYGCANHAELVLDYLLENNLEIDAFIVDSQYYKNNFYIRGIEVKDIAEYSNNLDKYNLVIGFCDPVKTQFLIYNSVILKSQFYLLWEPHCMYEWDEGYLKKNWNKIENVYQNLSDSISKNILDELINAKLTGWGKRLLYLADNRQYFNELTFCQNSENEVYVDCGAYIGDTIMKYASFTNGKYRKIYAFEPNKQNMLELNENVASLSNIEIINSGTWSERSILQFEEKGSASQIVNQGGKIMIPVITIDEVVNDDKVSFIKMDVEGSELESLKGAQCTISRNMPKLAICCYHKRDDILELYHYIKSFDNEKIKSKFYLRHHSNSVYETVLYAIPVKQKGIETK
nr:FkbM family methyltransferase [uncultured Schaedlerella sp.]